MPGQEHIAEGRLARIRTEGIASPPRFHMPLIYFYLIIYFLFSLEFNFQTNFWKTYEIQPVTQNVYIFIKHYPPPLSLHPPPPFFYEINKHYKVNDNEEKAIQKCYIFSLAGSQNLIASVDFHELLSR